MAIRSCRDKRTARFMAGERIKEFSGHERQIVKAIAKLQAAEHLVDLRSPPSNRFHGLGGDRSGSYSIRINDRLRLCFLWQFLEPEDGRDPLLLRGEAYDVEIVDYH
ncbi:type II toxin-antitoxin system RelE/ParE family toxin [Caenispirillum bisanense]|uniref:Proteic killer suppression protein n=1 Tax=Caenispirillum bisanense TaxID=414052 RepID=A0A286GJ80_9PROT|nr:type II toxin-antitoxin system RelE/ParE family toxin [Caenispirillum bisanense]SOD95593.1 proteic killer suppression protein [Caenispirillum bisanense]